MSLSATKRVWEDRSVAGPRRMLLLAIADFANDSGIAYPGVRKLAEMTCMSERRVQQLLAALQEEGRLLRVPNPGRGRFDCYQIVWRSEDAVNESASESADGVELDDEMGEETFAQFAQSFTHSDEVGEETFTPSAQTFTHSQQMGEETFTPSAQSFTHSDEMGEEAFTPSTQSFIHSNEKGEETFTHCDDERVKLSAEKVKVSAERVKVSAQKGETPSHTRVDPSLIQNNNQLQIQKSVLSAAAQGGDAEPSLSSKQSPELAPSAKSERVQFSRERVMQLAEARDAHPQGAVLPESLHAQLFGAEFASASSETTNLGSPGYAETNALPVTATSEGGSDSTPPVVPRGSTPADAPQTLSPRATDALQDALTASLAGIKAKMAESRVAAEACAEAEASLPPEEPAPTETPQQRYFKLLAWIVGSDYTTIDKKTKGQIAQAMGILRKAGYTEQDLRIFWQTIWLKDWRWTKQRSHPTLTQVRSDIGKIRVEQQAEALALRPSTERDRDGKPILTPEELEMQRLMREAKERGRVARETAQHQGVRLPDLQGHEVGLP